MCLCQTKIVAHFVQKRLHWCLGKWQAVIRFAQKLPANFDADFGADFIVDIRPTVDFSADFNADYDADFAIDFGVYFDVANSRLCG